MMTVNFKNYSSYTLGDLDWFHLETKMRALVRDILNPVLQQNAEESERYYEIDKRTKDFMARLEILEYSCFNSKKTSKSAPTIFDSIFNRFKDTVMVKILHAYIGVVDKQK